MSATIRSMAQTSAAYAGDPVALDWINRRCFTANAGDNKIRSYGMDTGLLIATSADGSGVVQYALDSAANLLSVAEAGGPVKKYDGATLAQIASLTTGYSNTAHGNIAAVTDAGGVNYLFLQDGGTFYLMNSDTMAAGTTNTLSAGKNSLLISGAPGSGLCYAADGYLGAANATSFTVWKLTTGAVVTSVHTVNSTDIDAAWTNFGLATPCLPIVMDLTDRNLIVLCQTTMAVTHPVYLVKLNAATGAVMWKVALPGGGGRYDGNGPASNTSMQHGMIAYLDDDFNVYCIDTIAGTLVATVAVPGISVNYPIGSNDGTGEIFLFGNYNSATMGAPAPLGSTPASYTNLWGDLVLGSGLGVGTYNWGAGGDTQFLGQGP